MFKKELNKINNLLDKIKTDINIGIISDFLEWFYKKINIHFNKKSPDIIPSKGEIYEIELGKNIGNEINKKRPCIVYSNYFFNHGNNITIIPLKSYKGKVNRNVHIFINKTKINNLDSDSIVEISAIKQVSKKRIGLKIGKLEKEFLEKIDKKLLKYLGIKK